MEFVVVFDAIVSGLKTIKSRLNSNMIYKDIGTYTSARLGFTRLFWRVRYWFGWLNFRRLRISFRLRDKLSNTATEASYWRALSRGVVLPIIFAIVFSLVLYTFEKSLPLFTNINWVGNNIIGKILLHPMNEDAYVAILTTIAGVVGVFLGLYFTAVSTVISNVYSSVSGDVRELILRDRLGNKYVNLLAFLIALSVVLLAFSTMKITTLHLAIFVLVVLSCLAIFAFVNLGVRMFFLSDPTLFFETLSTELMKWVRHATARGYQWQDVSFQTHYRRQALKVVKTLTTLAKISSKKPELQGESHPRLLKNLLALTSVYYDEKHSIPTNSGWYGRKLQHKQWYLSRSTELEMATQTDTPLVPNEIPDTTWLEDSLLDVIFKAFDTDIKAGDFQTLYPKVISLQDFFNGFGSNWLVDDGKKWHARLSKDILGRLTNGKSLGGAVQEIHSIATTELLASLPLSIEIGFSRAVNDLNVNELRDRLLRTKWREEESPYAFSLPPSTIKELEKIRDGAVFEKQAHAPHKTQNWYVAELALHDLDIALYNQWQSLMELIETWYKETGKALSDAKKYKQSATIYTRAIEQAWKLDSHIERLREVSEALLKDHKTNFIKQAKWDWSKEHKRVAKFRDMAIKGQADLIPYLWGTSKPDHDMPDFFGSAVHYTGEACYEALVAGDSDKFKSLFRPYFLGILGIFQSLIPQVSDWETSSALTWMSEPILDLYSISGYAYIFAEYHDKPEIWNECREAWDAILTRTPEQLESFAVISSYHQTPRGVITPRDSLRSRWAIDLINLLNNIPRQQSSDVFSHPPLEHKSELIRNIAPWSDSMPHMFVDAIDVFTVKYLITAQTNTQLDFGIDDSKITHINGRGDDNE